MEHLEIFIESLTGSLLQFHVSPFETILSLKEKIQNLQGIPVNHQHLVYQAQVLDNDLSLYSYNIQTGSTLRLILHMRGGPISTRPLTADLTSQQTLLEEMATEYMESLSGENWPTSATDGGGSVASGISGDSETQTDARAPSTTSSSPTPVPSSSKSHPRHVTLLVLRDGDQLNFYRVVDRSTSCLVPSNSSAVAPFEDLVSPSGSGGGEDSLSISDVAQRNAEPNNAATTRSVMVSGSHSTCVDPQPLFDPMAVEDRTRQKMAELRSRLMANNKQVHVSSAVGQPKKDGSSASNSLLTTPVVMPRPPSTLQRANLVAPRNLAPGDEKHQQQSSRPYVPSALSTLRRRRLPSQQSVVGPLSTGRLSAAANSPRDTAEKSDPRGNGNFASLADYFRSKEDAAALSVSDLLDNNFCSKSREKSFSPPPSAVSKASLAMQLPSTLASTNNDVTLPHHGQQIKSPLGSSTRRHQQQDLVRCAPYLRDLFAGTRFLTNDQDQQKEGSGNSLERAATTFTPRPSFTHNSSDIIKEADSHHKLSTLSTSVSGIVPFSDSSDKLSKQGAKTTSPMNFRNSSLAGSTALSRNTIRPQAGSVGEAGTSEAVSKPADIANAFAALIERQVSQTAPPTQPIFTGKSNKKSAAHASASKGNPTKSSTDQVQTAGSTQDGDADADVLEKALTTLLLKAELEHLGSSRLPVGLIQTPLQTGSGDKNGSQTNLGTSNVAPLATRTTSNPRQPVLSTSTFSVGNTAAFHPAVVPNKPLSDATTTIKSLESSRTANVTRLPAIPPPPQNRVPATTTRCAVCNRRTGLATTYVCRCSATFCTVHRYPETHQCTYDYKSEGRRSIQANNPVITADKLPKI